MPAHVAITFGTPIYPPSMKPNVLEDASASPDPAVPLSDPDSLIVEWAQQVVAMAGAPDFPIELASKRRPRK